MVTAHHSLTHTLSCSLSLSLSLYLSPHSFTLGIRINEFFGAFPFWYLLCLLPAATRQVQELAALLTLQTAVGKSRGFVRLALNSGGICLEEVLGAMLRNASLLQFFYHDSSLLRKPSESAVLVREGRTRRSLTHSLTHSLTGCAALRCA
jgi:hypothetical protein